MSQNVENAGAEELAALRAEVAYLRQELDARPDPPKARRMMEPDPDLPGLMGLWRGERGLAWQLFVQAAVTLNALLAVGGVVAIAAT